MFLVLVYSTALRVLIMSWQEGRDRALKRIKNELNKCAGYLKDSCGYEKANITIIRNLGPEIIGQREHGLNK